jgi:hypothetical protein
MGEGLRFGIRGKRVNSWENGLGKSAKGWIMVGEC